MFIIVLKRLSTRYNTEVRNTMTSFISSQMGDVEQDIVVLSDQPNVLNTCVNQPNRGRSKTRPYPLSELNDLKIQQGLIIKDLLFSLIGYEGCYIRYSEKYDQFQNKRP